MARTKAAARKSTGMSHAQRTRLLALNKPESGKETAPEPVKASTVLPTSQPPDPPLVPRTSEPWNHPDELAFLRPTWSEDELITYIRDHAFSVPGKPSFQADPFCDITLRDNTKVILPRGYRIPLMFVMKFQWESLRLVLTSASVENEWEDFKFDILHVARLCARFLEHARGVMMGPGMDRTWRFPMFDRALARYYRRWLVSREQYLKDFWIEFEEEVYQEDILKKDWTRFVLKGHKGFNLTKEECENGLPYGRFLDYIAIKDGRLSWVQTSTPLVNDKVGEANGSGDGKKDAKEAGAGRKSKANARSYEEAVEPNRSKSKRRRTDGAPSRKRAKKPQETAAKNNEKQTVPKLPGYTFLLGQHPFVPGTAPILASSSNSTQPSSSSVPKPVSTPVVVLSLRPKPPAPIALAESFVANAGSGSNDQGETPTRPVEQPSARTQSAQPLTGNDSAVFDQSDQSRKEQNTLAATFSSSGSGENTAVTDPVIQPTASGGSPTEPSQGSVQDAATHTVTMSVDTQEGSVPSPATIVAQPPPTESRTPPSLVPDATPSQPARTQSEPGDQMQEHPSGELERAKVPVVTSDASGKFAEPAVDQMGDGGKAQGAAVPIEGNIALRSHGLDASEQVSVVGTEVLARRPVLVTEAVLPSESPNQANNLSPTLLSYPPPKSPRQDSRASTDTQPHPPTPAYLKQKYRLRPATSESQLDASYSIGRRVSDSTLPEESRRYVSTSQNIGPDDADLDSDELSDRPRLIQESRAVLQDRISHHYRRSHPVYPSSGAPHHRRHNPYPIQPSPYRSIDPSAVPFYPVAGDEIDNDRFDDPDVAMDDVDEPPTDQILPKVVDMVRTTLVGLTEILAESSRRSNSAKRARRRKRQSSPVPVASSSQVRYMSAFPPSVNAEREIVSKSVESHPYSSFADTEERDPNTEDVGRLQAEIRTLLHENQEQEAKHRRENARMRSELDDLRKQVQLLGNQHHGRWGDSWRTSTDTNVRPRALGRRETTILDSSSEFQDNSPISSYPTAASQSRHAANSDARYTFAPSSANRRVGIERHVPTLNLSHGSQAGRDGDTYGRRPDDESQASSPSTESSILPARHERDDNPLPIKAQRKHHTFTPLSTPKSPTHK